MLFKGILIAAASGRIGNAVASHNRGVAYFRALGPPPGLPTARQTKSRLALADCFTRWRDVLTQAQRTLWAEFAHRHPDRTALGQEIILTPYAAFSREAFIRFHANRESLTTFGPITTPPTGATPYTSRPRAIAVPSLSRIRITWTRDPESIDDPNEGISVYISAPKAATINSLRSGFRLHHTIQGDLDGPPAPPWDISIPVMTAGQRLFVRCRAFSLSFPVQAPTLSRVIF